MVRNCRRPLGTESSYQQGTEASVLQPESNSHNPRECTLVKPQQTPELLPVLRQRTQLSGAQTSAGGRQYVCL